MSKSLLEYIKKNSLFEGEKGVATQWRSDINKLYNNWLKVGAF